MRRPSSSAVPMVRPSIWVRSEVAIASTVRPRRPASIRFTDDRIILRAFVERRVHVLGAIDAGQDRRQLARDLVELRDVRTEDLHRDVAAHAADHLLHAHVDRLREAERQSRKVGEHLPELLQQRGLVGRLSLLRRASGPETCRSDWAPSDRGRVRPIRFARRCPSTSGTLRKDGRLKPAH